MADLSEPARELREKIDERRATVAVVGLGYVGLPLVETMHAAGFRVVGYDRDGDKIRKLRAGENYLRHLGEEMTRELAASDRFVPTDNPELLRGALELA